MPRLTREQAAKKREASEKAHAYRLRKYFRITPEQYWDTYNFQGGKCAICMIATGRTKRLAVDHNHKCYVGHDPKEGCPECIRGLLCSTCNTFVGRVRDNPEVFERGMRYLRNPPFQFRRDMTSR